MIKAIIFDLGGVLFTNGTKQFVQTISDKHRLEPAIVRSVVDGDLGTKYRESKITRDEFWSQLKAQLQLTEPVDLLESEWIDGYKLIDGTKEIIEELRGKYSLYYLSDNVRERVEKINERYGFIAWFQDGVFSHDVGVRKPDPSIYQLVLAKAAARPEEAIFIDDKPEMLPAAKTMGMTTILFETPEKLRQDLTALHIL